MLTLVPKDWSIQYTSNYFGVSEYVVRQARDLNINHGQLAELGAVCHLEEDLGAVCHYCDLK